MYTSSDINLLEAVQNRAACWICATYDRVSHSWNKSSSTCLGELKWTLLAHRQTYFTIDYLHSILHHKTIFQDYFKLKPTSSSTRSHQLTIQPASSSINAFRYSFFVNSIFYGTAYPLISYVLRVNIFSTVNCVLIYGSYCLFVFVS